MGRTLLRHEGRRRHSLNAARIKIFRVAFFQKFDRDPIDTTRILQSINAVAGLGDNDMSAVGQMPGNLFAVIWWRDRISGAFE